MTQPANPANTINRGLTHSIPRWIHIIFSIPILGYIYSPFDKLPDYAFKTRFVFVPVMILSGLWMWKGHVVRRLFSRKDRLEKPGDRSGSSLRPLRSRALDRRGS